MEQASRRIATALAIFVLLQSCLTAATLVFPTRIMAPAWVGFGISFSIVIFAMEKYKARRGR